MALQRITAHIEPRHFDYRVVGIGTFLAELVAVTNESTRNKMATELLDFLYPKVDSDLLIRVRQPLAEIIEEK